MTILRLEVSGFRNLTSVRLSPSPGINLLFGENASGKTSLLEAIYFLASARSFRTGRISNLINSESDCFTLFAENILTGHHHHRIGMRRCRGGNDISRLDGMTLQKRSSLLEALPLQIISPESLTLLVESSERRRSFIDWGLFHVEQSFRDTWLNFSRALKQRNALLRVNVKEGLKQWSEIFIEHAETLTQLRSNYVETIRPCFMELVTALLPGVEISLGYQQGWQRNFTLLEALKNNEELDLRMKYTNAGPQRADLQVRHDGRRAVDVLSRGQMKLVVFALLIAQMEAMGKRAAVNPILLVDDLAAELDPRHREFLMKRINALNTQVFVTTPDLGLLDISVWSEGKMFHVEHGEIKEMV